MKLTTRTCNDCGSEFDLIENKYFFKIPNKFKQTIEIVIKSMIPTVMNQTIFERKLICEVCNRENKLKEIGI